MEIHGKVGAYHRTTHQKFEDRIERRSNGCWIWTGAIAKNGYGRFWYDGKYGYAHRYAFEDRFGPIIEGFVVDHLCRVRSCANPEHLEMVTQAENLLRSPATIQAKNAAKTSCPRGHPYDVLLGTDKRRWCSICHAESRRDGMRRLRERKRNNPA